MRFYRALLEMRYPYRSTGNGWGTEEDWVFFCQPPDEFIKNKNDNPNLRWRIKYLHEISAEEFKDKIVYSVPINQTVFHP